VMLEIPLHSYFSERNVMMYYSPFYNFGCLFRCDMLLNVSSMFLWTTH